MKLSICIPTLRDYSGLWSTTLNIVTNHPEVLDAIEIIVVSNEANTQVALQTQEWVSHFLAANVRARFVNDPTLVGPAQVKQRCITEATSPWVLVMDSHVLIAKHGLQSLINHLSTLESQLDSALVQKNLYTGPLVYDQDAKAFGTGEPLRHFASHQERTWRGHDLGIWATDQRASSVDGQPFEIPMQGSGLFVVHRERFVGFCPQFAGFGAEESYLAEKTRQAGGNVVCLPYLRWIHRFRRPEGVPYRVTLQDKVRNYVVGFQDLGLPLNEIQEHFLNPAWDTKSLGPQITLMEWESIVSSEHQPQLAPSPQQRPGSVPGSGMVTCLLAPIDPSQPGVFQCQRPECGRIIKSASGLPPDKLFYQCKARLSQPSSEVANQPPQATAPPILCRLGEGPGDYLHGLINRWFKEDYTPSCKCKDMVNRMNRLGPVESRKQASGIAMIMQQEAEKRGWKLASKFPWTTEQVCRVMVVSACRKAERAAKRALKQPAKEDTP